MKNLSIVLLLFFCILNTYATEFNAEHITDFGVGGDYCGFDGYIEFPYLFTFCDYGLEVFTISDINGDITSIATLPIPGLAYSMQKIGENVFISNYNPEYTFASSLYKIDVSNPFQPEITESLIDCNYGINQLRDYNEYLAFHKTINGYCTELVFLDIIDLEEVVAIPWQHSTYAVNDTIIGHLQHPNYNSATLYNISDIENITFLTNVDLSASSFVGGNIYPLGDNKIVITPNDGLSFWDVSDIYNWQFLSDYTTVTPGSKFGGVNRIDDYLLVPQQSTCIEVLDIGDFSDPAFVSFWDFPDFFYYYWYFSYSHILNYDYNLYIGTFQDGIFSLSFENGYISFSNKFMSDVLHFIDPLIYDNHLITTSYNDGSQIYDISDLETPFKVTSILDSNFTFYQDIHSGYLITKYDDREYINKVAIFDIADITSPLMLSEFSSSNEFYYLLNPSENNAIYLQYVFPTDKIEKYDISQPEDPQLIMEFDLPESMSLGFFHNNYTYFLTDENGYDLYIYSNFENEQPILENHIIDFCYGTYCHITHIPPYLQLFSLSTNEKFYDLLDPLNPSVAFTLDRSSSGYTSYIKDSVLYSPDNYVINLFDISNNPSGQLEPFESMLLNSWYRGLNFINIGNQNYLLVTQLECISVYEYEIVFSAVDDELISVSPQLTNYPNPFNPETKIVFNIPESSKVKVEIFNVKGQKVRQLVSGIRQLPDGQHSIIWNGTDENNQQVSTGVYFYQLEVDGKPVASRKMLMMK
jgi:hypothetical protein